MGFVVQLTTLSLLYVTRRTSSVSRASWIVAVLELFGEYLPSKTAVFRLKNAVKCYEEEVVEVEPKSNLSLMFHSL